MAPLHSKLAAETHPAEGKYAYDDGGGGGDEHQGL